MVHSFKLGYKANPFGTDDYIDLADPSFGYQLMGYELGDVAVDDTNREIRTLNLKVNALGVTSQSAVQQKVRKIRSYIQQTVGYLEPQGGNIESDSDGSWHEGHAATLTVKLDGSQYPVYWEVIDGKVTNRADFIDLTYGNNIVSDIHIELRVVADARGDRVILDNLVHCGDFPPEWTVAASATWFFNTPAAHTVDTATISPVNTPSLLSTGFATYAFYSNPSGQRITGDKIVPSLYFKTDQALSGSQFIEFVLESTSTQNGSPAAISGYGPTSNGVIALYNVANPAPVNQWIKVSGPAYTVTGTGDAYITLALSCGNLPTTAKVWYSAPALWRNPTGSLAPVEYASCGQTPAQPQYNIYNIQGDMPAPVKFRGAFNEGSFYTGAANGGVNYVHFGGRQLTRSVDAPILPLQLHNTIDNANANLLFGGFSKVRGTLDTTNKKAPFTITTTGTLDRRARNYRLLMYYAFENDINLTGVTITICGETRFYGAMPGTTSNNVASSTVATDYKFADMGEFHFGRKGNGWANLTGSITGTVTFQFGVVMPVTPLAYFTGFLAIPTEQYALLNYGATTQTKGTFLVETESDNIAAGYVADASAYDPLVVPNNWNNFAVDASYYGGNLTLLPSLNAASFMSYMVMPLTYVSGDVSVSGPVAFSCDSRVQSHIWCEYSPRFELGMNY